MHNVHNNVCQFCQITSVHALVPAMFLAHNPIDHHKWPVNELDILSQPALVEDTWLYQWHDLLREFQSINVEPCFWPATKLDLIQGTGTYIKYVPWPQLCQSLHRDALLEVTSLWGHCLTKSHPPYCKMSAWALWCAWTLWCEAVVCSWQS